MGELLKEWHGFTPGQDVVLLEETIGDDHEGIEHTMPAGAIGTVDHIERYTNDQGVAVHVIIWVNNERDRSIVNVFDEMDGPITNFLKAKDTA
ncbi:hypothetical protein [Bradyrhizobium sp. SZCCHNS3053]|uniref:hypothetical protein n=1 Tax=Bradyrhizobium sp. SZCCHNS3053 TaxID=3057322 RepID=UPI002916BD56|nr:hypothetical protein [Bradyrhizobium sp. SZCCHNS3053]